MLTWGIIVILTGFAQSASHLYILRFLLGVAEAGFFPGIILYLTYWFRERERGRATAVLLLALPIGGLIGAPLSAWIIDNIAWASLEGWRWMFILEGIPALILGIITIFYLTDRPSKAKWLSQEEIQWLEGELEVERQQSLKLNKPSKLAMLKDTTVWKLSAFYFAGYTGVYGLSFWVPTIIKSLSDIGSTNMEIGWMAMLPSLVGIPAIIFTGLNADRTGKHKLHLLVCLAIAIIGFIGCALVTSLWPMVAMLSLASAGLYGFTGSFFAYLTFFFTESTAPVGIALVNSFAALGGFVGPTILGMFNLNTGMFALAIILIVGIIILYTMPKTNIEIQSENKEGSVRVTTSGKRLL